MEESLFVSKYAALKVPSKGLYKAMPERYRPIRSSLRSKILIVTVLFVMLVEAFVYFPAIATFRETYLSQTLKAAQIAAMSLEASPMNRVTPELERNLLAASGVVSIVMRRNDQSRMLGFDQMPSDVETVYDIRGAAIGSLIADAMETFSAEGDRYISVIGEPILKDTMWIEMTVYEEELYEAMIAHSNNLIILSALISFSTGLLVYLCLHWVVVRPMRRLKKNIVRFQSNSEDPKAVLPYSKRRDEIGVVSRELRSSQQHVQQSLKQKQRLAELGEAISKINHDLRGMLTTASLASSTLARVEDPKITRITGRLERALTRAIDLCTRTLKYGSAKEPDPVFREVNLHDLASEIADSLNMGDSPVEFHNAVPIDYLIPADPDQLFRVIYNLVKNSLEAMEVEGSITVAAKPVDDYHQIRLCDTGPGFNEEAQAKLFKPFVSTTRKTKGGTGLGLAIAKEMVEAHKGTIELEETSQEGSHFLIYLPINPDS
ncbi:HAMP domain-containing sensor histidine kinase [Temperatibacter marinus]|uniref:histidine kinase n=1 Tax=Temperatibacter marinus TaxID=1456591 RepID=A0AA52HAL7_9PROT|nr:HAMP domain-containing sensor histidine kinase [Temperatibacter marinus]WND04104.1 HAMP domain-containing sensor histidine kinase [Temperatibacter marinus]